MKILVFRMIIDKRLTRYNKAIAELKDDFSGDLVTEFEINLTLKTRFTLKKIGIINSIKFINLTPEILLGIFGWQYLADVLSV